MGPGPPTPPSPAKRAETKLDTTNTCKDCGHVGAHVHCMCMFAWTRTCMLVCTGAHVHVGVHVHVVVQSHLGPIQRFPPSPDETSGNQTKSGLAPAIPWLPASQNQAGLAQDCLSVKPGVTSNSNKHPIKHVCTCILE